MPRRRPHRIARCGASALALAIACGWAGPLHAGPKGGVVTHGDAAIRASGQVTAIQQSSDRIIIDWRSFDVGADETVRFEQPRAKSIALNRVAAGAASRIEGAIEANGNVWLVNPSGVMFGQGARVDVGGLIVSTSDISNEDFIKGNMVFDRSGDPGAQIVNDGKITFAEAGLAGFVAPEVINRGRIAGRLGRITIAGKDSFSVDISGDGMFELDLSDAAPAAHARLINDGALVAEGGLVVIDAASARDAIDGTVSAGGVISAASADVSGGKIVLRGGSVTVSGTVDASSGAGRGGTVAMTGDLVHAASGAVIDASGETGGGVVRIGALAPDMAPMPARRTLVSAGATVRADGREGLGGDILVWGQQVAAMRGALSARGATTGGLIEVSSPGAILFDGTADATGTDADGLILFDPTFLTIGALGTHDLELGDGEILAGEDDGASWFISAATLNGLGGNVRLQASDTIRVDQQILFGGDLTLEAGRDILLFADIHAGGDLTLTANAAVSGAPAITDGAIMIDAGRSIGAGGALTLSAGADGRLDGGAMAAGDVLRLTAGGDLTASAMTLAGALSVESHGAAKLTKNMLLSGDVDVTTHGGAIQFASLSGAVQGAVTLDARGGAALAGDVTVQFGGTLTLAGLDARNAQILAIDGIDGAGLVSLTGVSTFQTRSGDVALTNGGNSFGGGVRVLTVATAGAAPGDVTLRASGDLSIAQIVGAAATLQADGAVTQTGDVSLSGDARVEAGDDIILTRTGNAFGGTLSLSGAAATIGSASAMEFGASQLASLTVSSGALSQSGALDIAGATMIATTGDAVTLTDLGNSFGGGISVLTNDGGAMSADVALANAGALELDAIAADALAVSAGGALTQSAAWSADGSVDLRSDGAVKLNKSNVFLDDLDVASQGGKITIASLTGQIDGVMTLDASDGGARGDVLVQIGGAAVLGAVTARQAQIFAADGIVGHGALDISGASTFQTRSTDIALSNAANSFGGEVRLLAQSTVDAPGDVAVAAAGDLIIAQLTAREAIVDTGGRLTQTGVVSTLASATFSAGDDLTFTNSGNAFGGVTRLSGQDVRLVASGDLTLGDTSAQSLALTLPGALGQTEAVAVAGILSLDVGESASLGRADNLFSQIDGAVAGASTTLRDADGFALTGLSAGRLSIGAISDRQAGDVVVGGVFGADAAIYTLGDVTIDTVLDASFGDRATLDAGGTLRAAVALRIADAAQITAAEDVVVGALIGTSAAVSGHDVTIETVDLAGALIIDAGNDLRLGDASLGAGSAAGDIGVTAGGGAQISAIIGAGTLAVDAGAGIDLTAATIASDAILSTAAGDLRLAGVNIGGDFGAHSGGGAITSRSLAGQSAPSLSVGGATRLDAWGAVRLPAADGSEGHVFGGPVSVTRAASVAIEAAGDLTFGATDIAFAALEAQSTGGIFDRTGGDLPGGIHLKSSGAVAGVGPAYIRSGGDLRLQADGAVSLLGANDIGGAVSVTAASLDWAELGDILLADIASGADVRLISGMDGALGDASIRQGATATVPRLAVADGAAQSGVESFSGPVTIGGDLDLSSGLAAGTALADIDDAEVDRSVDLSDPDNVFNGSVALRRIAGDAILTEESGPENIAQDALDGGALHLRQIEVNGDIYVTTSDDVIFDGRMTSIADSDIPASKPTIPVGPDADDPGRQGLADLAPEAFRLWLSDGATLTVDTTAGGADAAGGAIRFDRPVDGFNQLTPERTLQSVNQRAGGGALQLKAGLGDIRFRDYVGAGAPVGDVTIMSARDVAIGHTYADRDPDSATPGSRFLLGRSDETDVFFASDLKIDATGDVVLHAPAGLRDKFETNDAFFGVNLRGFTYGLSLRPTSVEAFGFIGGSSRKAAGLYPVGPRAPQYNLNGCVIGDVADCTGVSAPNVLTVLRLDRAQILNVEREDLFELFVSYGNEELWGVPSGYILDLKDLRSGEEDEEDQEDQVQVVPLRGAGG